MSTTKHRCAGCGRWLAVIDDGTLEVVKKRRAVLVSSRYMDDGAGISVRDLDSREDDALIARGLMVPAPARQYSQVNLVCDCKRRWVVRRDTPRTV